MDIAVEKVIRDINSGVITPRSIMINRERRLTFSWTNENVDYIMQTYATFFNLDLLVPAFLTRRRTMSRINVATKEINVSVTYWKKLFTTAGNSSHYSLQQPCTGFSEPSI